MVQGNAAVQAPCSCHPLAVHTLINPGSPTHHIGNSPRYPVIPGNGNKAKLKLARTAFAHWGEQGKIATQAATAINEKLLKQQDGFAANIIKSAFKNYLDRADAVPGGAGDVLGLLGGVAGDIPWDMPDTLSQWSEASQTDAAILEDQAGTIAKLRNLHQFCLHRAGQVVSEMKNLKTAVTRLKELTALDNATADAIRELAPPQSDHCPLTASCQPPCPLDLHVARIAFARHARRENYHICCPAGVHGAPFNKIF